MIFCYFSYSTSITEAVSRFSQYFITFTQLLGYRVNKVVKWLWIM